jgi:hypothetical protein
MSALKKLSATLSIGLAAAVIGSAVSLAAAQAAPQEPLWAMVKKEKPVVVETLRDLVNIESVTGAIDPRLVSDRRNPQVVSEFSFAGGNISP